jgi:hypothetical protein
MGKTTLGERSGTTVCADQGRQIAVTLSVHSQQRDRITRSRPVPDSLGDILTELTRAGRTHTGIGSPADSQWLFPGGMPGQPITAARLGQRLRSIGIRALPGRRAALIDLASQLPAAVLADTLNLSSGTAVRWMHQAGADWNRYAADLARYRDHQPWPIATMATQNAGPFDLLRTTLSTGFDAGVPLRDVQEAASHADPRTTMRYDRARASLDRHATYILAAYVAGAAR